MINLVIIFIGANWYFIQILSVI